MTYVQAILFLAAIYNLVLVGIILWRSHTQKAGTSFAYYILSTVVWTLAIAVMQFPAARGIALPLARFCFFIAVFIAVSWLWFCADFPVTSRRFRKAALVLTLLWVPWLFLPWTDLIIPAVAFRSWGVDPAVGPLVGLFALWSEGVVFAGGIHLWYKTRQVRGIERLQIRYILLGFVGLVVVGGLINMILPAMGITRFVPFGPLASLFITTTTTYAMVRYRLMDIRIVLRAGLVYSITIGTLSLLFALLVPVFNTALTDRFHFPPTTGSFIMAFLMALAFQPLRRHVQHLVDRRFFKSVYDYRVTLREAGSALASVRDREFLVNTLANALARTLRPRGVAVFLPGGGKALTRIEPVTGWDDLPRTLQDSDPVVVDAVETDEVLLSDEFIRLPEPKRSIGLRMRSWSAYVAIPLIAGDRLCGMVFLGEKLSGDVYTADDVGLLRILGKQASIALDNARHYDEVVQMNEYHERLLNTMQDGVIALDPRRRVMTFNPSAERITGVSAAAAAGKRLEEIGITQLPITDMGGEAVETSLTTREGAEIPILVTVTPFRRRWDTADSHLIVFHDLSALRALEMQKMQAERFSSMGAMAASLAHEIKNPLVPIQTFAHLLPTKYDDEEFREDFSRTVVKEVERINRLVGQMLDLVRKPAHDRSPVDLCEVVDRLVALIRPECERRGIALETMLPKKLLTVVGVAGQLYQAILNVLTNSVQAMPAGGTLTIAVAADGDDILCRISDTGPGVPQEDLSRIFEPLYTTKVGGSGLGLALTYQLLRAHGGEVRAESQPGAGLAVILTLPALRAAETELLCS